MIEPREISKVAAFHKLRETQIEKDYAIGWVLKGIANNDFLRKNLIFKGGTAIRKVYIENYRLSEDLDFTYKETNMNSEQLKKELENVIDWIKKESRIEMEIENEKVNTFGNYSLELKYVGPLGGRNNSIKMDVSSNEKLCNEPLFREIIDNYSDSSEVNSILSYSINEILSEKMRSLMQRTAPRDLYDIWFMLESEGYEITDCIADFIEKQNTKI